MLALMLLSVIDFVMAGNHGSFTLILTVFCSTRLFLFSIYLLLSMGLSNTSIQNKPKEHMVEITCA